MYCRSQQAENYVLLLDPRKWFDYAAHHFVSFEILPGNLQYQALPSPHQGVPQSLNPEIKAYDYWDMAGLVGKLRVADDYIRAFKGIFEPLRGQELLDALKNDPLLEGHVQRTVRRAKKRAPKQATDERRGAV